MIPSVLKTQHGDIQHSEETSSTVVSGIATPHIYLLAMVYIARLLQLLLVYIGYWPSMAT